MRTALSTIILSLTLSAPAFAADRGTYRPGQPYQSVPAGNAEQCASQCQGDAQCKGWNFVMVRPNMPGGICEFNALSVSPVPSPMSISGGNNTVRTSSRLIPAGTRTTRVGTPYTAPPVAAAQQTVSAQTAPGASPQRRRIVRTPVPQTRAVRPVVHKSAPVSLTEQQNLQRGRHTAPQVSAPAVPASAPAPRQQAMTRPVLKTHSPVPVPNNNPSLSLTEQQNRQRSGSPYQHNLDSGRAAPQSAPSYPSQMIRPPQFSHNLDSGSARGRSASQAPASAATRPTPPAAPAPQITMPSQPYLPPVSAEQAQQSLFGSLHDDVSTPLILTPDQIPLDTDIPIPTVTSLPTQSIIGEDLMAGPPAR